MHPFKDGSPNACICVFKGRVGLLPHLLFVAFLRSPFRPEAEELCTSWEDVASPNMACYATFSLLAPWRQPAAMVMH